MDTDNRLETLAAIAGIIYCLVVLVFAIIGDLYG